MQFTNKVVIITGGGGGIGLATAKKFASLQATVVLADLNQQHLEEAAAEVKKAGAADVWPCVCDVSNESNVEAAVTGCVERFKTVDVIVNNAGLMVFKPIEEQTLDDWEKIFKVDLFGAFFFIKHAFKNMKAGGAIVNVSSIHAIETE